MIIIEGIDGTGKSTLAKAIASITPTPLWEIQESEGPAKSGQEILERIARYYPRADETIFVRHPCISQPLYNTIREGGVVIPQNILDEFYKEEHLIIYCDPGFNRHEHVIKEGESPLLIKQIEDNYQALLQRYRVWAAHYASVLYRIGDNVDMIKSNVISYTLRQQGYSFNADIVK